MRRPSGPGTVLVISQVPPPVHGSSVMTRHLLDSLEESGRRVVLVDRRFSRSVSEIGRVQVRKVALLAGLLARLVVALVRSRPSCVVLFATNRPASFLSDVAMVALLRAARVPTVHYLHTNGFRALASRGAGWRVLVRFLLGSARRVVCLGATLVEDVTPWVERSRIVVIPNSSPVVPGGGVSPSPSEKPTVLFMSNLLPEKGAHVAVEVGLVLCAEKDDLDVLLAGADADHSYTSGLQRRVEEAGMQRRIRFLGAVAPADRPALMDEADLLLFPSTYRFEAQPLTIVEAMAAGLPVVAYAVGGIPDLVESGRTGELVAPGDEALLIDTVRRLLDDAGLRAEQAAGARGRHAELHTPEAFGRSWSTVLDAVERT